ncbi:MAG TPA: hypothetical protein VGR14_19410 [Verrucomicrobiae bacterium]|jgi:hypothetical protein|nr:hypothetical protein [Verrucomicrobiae bacterium]
MNNPNPFYDGGPVAVLHDDFDAEQFLHHVFDALVVREIEIRSWFQDKGFVDVRVRALPLYGPDGWECLMLRGHNDECCNCVDLKALVMRLAGDLQCLMEADEIWAVVWSDRVGTHFRLKPQPI